MNASIKTVFALRSACECKQVGDSYTCVVGRSAARFARPASWREVATSSGADPERARVAVTRMGALEGRRETACQLPEAGQLHRRLAGQDGHLSGHRQHVTRMVPDHTVFLEVSAGYGRDQTSIETKFQLGWHEPCPFQFNV